MKKIHLIILIALSFSSCKKWLDAQPESNVSKDELFETEEGFQEALNGIYSRCAQGDIYGNELTFGYLDVLAQNYTISFNDPYAYLKTSQYNYDDNSFISRKDNAWGGLYQAITNCNLILENIDDHKSLFTGNNYPIIKGEALALRGYLHFDLLRQFAPSYKSNPNAAAIPYVTSYSNRVTPLSTVQQTLQLITTDLEAARDILSATDSIRNADYVVGYPDDDDATELEANTLFQQNRRHRLNYYAVCAELARVYLYEEDKPKALSYALEVIQSKKFPWTTEADFIAPDDATKDRIMYKELIFGWYIPDMADDLISRFGQDLSSLYVEENAGNAIYESGSVGGEDNRFKQWFQLDVSSNIRRYELLKYKRNQDGDENATNRHPLMAPAIRLSEMYYIAAECTYDSDPTTALGYLDEVRNNRGIGTPVTAANKEAFLTELVKEARKEFYGEGQIFYMYKRLNRNIVAQSGLQIPASDEIFVLPLPNNEIEYGGR